MKIIIEISDKRVADLLCSAMEGGIGYWCKADKQNKPTRVVPATDDWKWFNWYVTWPLHGGSIKLLTSDEVNGEHRFVLDGAALQRGFDVMQEKYPRHFGNFLAENDDAETGDVFVQCCVFGELVFG